MSYYSKEGDAEPKGVINFDLTRGEIKITDKKSFE